MKKIIMGIVCGLLNGLFGSGGGVAAVPMLESSQLEPKKSHATSVAFIFLLSAATTISYYLSDKLDFSLTWQYMPYGIIGGIIGAILLNKLPNSLLRRIFGVVMIFAALRIFIKL